ncbi:MAG TPA: hypothetical protein VJ783_22730 [Pirellulales bacterium]|nr:hypothetical protein [Pirellulales bacterium]
MLATVEAVITKRLAGDAYESYSEQELQFHGTELDTLFKIRERLRRTSQPFALAAFSRPRNVQSSGA